MRCARPAAAFKGPRVGDCWMIAESNLGYINLRLNKHFQYDDCLRTRNLVYEVSANGRKIGQRADAVAGVLGSWSPSLRPARPNGRDGWSMQADKGDAWYQSIAASSRRMISKRRETSAAPRTSARSASVCRLRRASVATAFSPRLVRVTRFARPSNGSGPTAT